MVKKGNAFISCIIYFQAISTLITPRIDKDKIEDFLWKHIGNDIDTLQKLLERNRDEVLLWLHALMNHLAIGKTRKYRNIYFPHVFRCS